MVVITPSCRRPLARAPRRLSRLVPATALALVAGVLGAAAATALPSPARPGSATPTSRSTATAASTSPTTTSTTATGSAADGSRAAPRLTVEATQDLSSFHLDFLLPVRGVRVDGARGRRSPSRAGTRSGSCRRRRCRPGRSSRSGSSVRRAARRRSLRRREQLARRPPRGRGDEPAAHGAVVVPRPTTTRADKALMDISITVPSRQEGRRQRPPGRPRAPRRRWSPTTGGPTSRWRPTSRCSPPGRFHVETRRLETGHGDVPVRLLVSERLGPARYAASLKMLRRTPRLAARGSQDDLGDYPFSAAGGLVTSLPVGFALENQTMPDLLLGRPAATTTGSSSTSRPTSGSATRSRSSGGATSGSTRAPRPSSRSVTASETARRPPDAATWLQRQWQTARRRTTRSGTSRSPTRARPDLRRRRLLPRRR